MIKSEFKSYGSYITDSVYQWDLNQWLSVDGLNVALAPLVAFSCSVVKQAVVVQSKIENGVIKCAIPNALLQFDKDITVHFCTMSGDQYKAFEKMVIPVIARAMPANYLYTDNVPVITSEAVISHVEDHFNNVIEDTENEIMEKAQNSFTRWININDYKDLMIDNDWSTVINHLIQSISGAVSIYFPTGTYNCYSTIYINKRNCRFIGETREATLKLMSRIDKFIDATGDSKGFEINTLELDCNNLADYGIYSSDWISEGRLVNFKLGRARVCGFYAPVFLTTFDKCWIHNSPTGFELPIFEETRGTSTTFKTVFTSDCSVAGIVADLTYSSLIDCASDRNAIGYYMRDCKGVNMIGCGAEKTTQIIKSTSWWGGSVLGFYGYNNGAESLTDADYLIELNSAVNLTISGYNGTVVGSPKLLALLDTRYGSENITILDDSIRPGDVYYKGNQTFEKPIKFLRRDETLKDKTYTIASIEDMTNAIADLPPVINHTITFDVTEDLGPITKSFTLKELKGCGRVVINLNEHTIGSQVDGYKIFKINNCSVKIIVSGGTLFNNWNSNQQQLIEVLNGDLSVAGIIFKSPTGYKCGSAITAKNGSNVVVGSNCVKEGIFESDNKYSFLTSDEISFIHNKMN